MNALMGIGGLILLIELVAGIGIIYYWVSRRVKVKARRERIEQLIAELENPLITVPRGWPEENDPTLVSQDQHIGDTGEWSECEDGCPQTGVMGIHSDRYCEREGRCQWCGKLPPELEEDYQKQLDAYEKSKAWAETPFKPFEYDPKWTPPTD